MVYQSVAMTALRLRESNQWTTQPCGHSVILDKYDFIPSNGSKLEDRVGGVILLGNPGMALFFRLPDHSIA